MKSGWNYKRAGVDIDKAEEMLRGVKICAGKTLRPEVLSDIGGFAGIVRVSSRWKKPCLVAGSDGVGTKLKIAWELRKHDTVGIDLVAMCVNDVLCSGAEPLFFLDYFACGKLEKTPFETVLSGIIAGCQEARCTLLGGETAEMPDMYSEGEYDMAGFAVGIVEEERIVDGKDIREGDLVFGFLSSGLHSNGFSLVRKVLSEKGVPFHAEIEGKSLAGELLRPTRIYVPLILSLLDEVSVKGMAHITGGGIIDNLPRILPEGLNAIIQKRNIPVPWIFQFLRELGDIPEMEMWRVFNMGIGFIVVLSPEEEEKFVVCCRRMGEEPILLGNIEKGERKVELVG
ncbi:MAG: phosphoribosylformylglycinamidine cyclo-ligase [Candidatus Caldatribacteriaceae bacterium]